MHYYGLCGYVYKHITTEKEKGSNIPIAEDLLSVRPFANTTDTMEHPNPQP